MSKAKTFVLMGIGEDTISLFKAWCYSHSFYVNRVAERLFRAVAEGEVKVPKKVLDLMKADTDLSNNRRREGQKKGQENRKARNGETE